MTKNTQYLPVLVVAKNPEGNFVHARDADKNKSYMCPCCNGNVRIRAINSQKVQPHFYHSDGSGCSDETIMHWLYKNWLFEQGSKFKVDNKIYVVQEIAIEKMFSTKHGNYIPDIYVSTDLGKRFFFEINYSNKKNNLFADKWIELDIDVVEVDIKELVYSSYSSSVPEFTTIFENGKYVGKYEKKNRKDIYTNDFLPRKEEINNDVERNNRLDRFWGILSQYKAGVSESNTLISCIYNQSVDDAVWCYTLIKRIKCCHHDDLSIVANHINKMIVDDIIKSNVEICMDVPMICELKKISPRRIELTIQFTGDIQQYNFVYKVQATYNLVGDLIQIVPKQIKDLLIILKFHWESFKDFREKISIHITSGEVTISGKTHDSYCRIDLNDLISITFWGNVHNQWIKEPIGELYSRYTDYRNRNFDKLINAYMLDATKGLDCEFFNAAYQNSSSIMDAVTSLNNKYHNSGYACSYYSDILFESHLAKFLVVIKYGKVQIGSINLNKFKRFDCGEMIETRSSNIISTFEKKYSALLRLVGKINSSANGFWNCCVEECSIYLRLKIQVNDFPQLKSFAKIDLLNMNYEEQVNAVTEAMNKLFISKSWDEVRIMEENSI